MEAVSVTRSVTRPSRKPSSDPTSHEVVLSGFRFGLLMVFEKVNDGFELNGWSGR